MSWLFLICTSIDYIWKYEKTFSFEAITFQTRAKCILEIDAVHIESEMQQIVYNITADKSTTLGKACARDCLVTFNKLGWLDLGVSAR